MKIDFLCPSGSPVGICPEDIYGRGVGGAELALMTFAQVLASRGHIVRIYNDPPTSKVYGGVEYLKVAEFQPGELRDATVLFRVPYKKLGAIRGLKVFWSCDQSTVGNYPTDVFPYVDKIVVISQHHYDHFVKTYNAPVHRMYVTDLGVRDWDYPSANTIEKIVGRCIFCSVPGRGLDVLLKVWPLIRKEVPHATLTITSDYRLWGIAEPRNEEYRRMAQGLEGIQFLGKVSREQLVREQMSAEVQAYPCTYEELFCISVAECSFAGAVPVTSQVGAVRTTNAAGYQIEGDPNSPEFQTQFALRVVKLLRDSELRAIMSESTRLHAQTNFNWSAIALLWEEQVLVK